MITISNYQYVSPQYLPVPGLLQSKNSLLGLTTVPKPIIRIPFTCSNKQIPCFPLTERECCLCSWLEKEAYLPCHFLLLLAWFAILCRSASKKQFSAGSAAAGFLQDSPLPARSEGGSSGLTQDWLKWEINTGSSFPTKELNWTGSAPRRKMTQVEKIWLTVG